VDIQNPLNYIADNPNNPFEKAKNAVGNVVEDVVGSGVGKKVLGSLDKPMEVLNYLATPYRDYAAPALTAALMETNSKYREQNKNASVTERFTKTFEDTKKGLTSETDWRRGISPGRALVGAIGDWVPGVQGTDKLDWSNAKEVDNYFTSGSTQFFSGVADAGFNTFDPAAGALNKGSRIVRRAVTRDINKAAGPTRETLFNELKTAAVDPTVRSGANEFMKLVEKNPEDIVKISNYGFVANSTDPTRLATAISTAYKEGGREHLADFVGAALGHKESYNKIVASSSVLHAQLLENSNSTQKIQKQLENLRESFQKNTDPTPEEHIAYSQAQADMHKSLKAIDDEGEKIARKLAPTDLITSNEQVIDNKVWSKYALPERLKAMAAEANTSGMFITVDGTKKFSTQREMFRNLKDPKFYGRTMVWLSPNTPLHEAPSGVALIGGAPGRRSFQEGNARIRKIAKLTNMSVDEQRSLQNEMYSLVGKSAQYNFFENLQARGIEGLLKKHYGKEYDAMNAAQLESAKVFAQELVNGTVRAQLRGKAKLFAEENGYTTIDDLTGNPISHAYLDDIVEQGALERAVARGRSSAEDVDRQAVRNAMGEQPLMETQVPNAHFSIDFDMFDQVMGENRTLLGNVMDEILSNSISDIQVRKMMESAEAAHLSGTTGMGSANVAAVKNMTRTGKDLAIEGLDTFYSYVWKPVTLMSLKYTTRNLGEGHLRFGFTMADYAAEYGFSWTDMLKGIHDPGSVKRMVHNRNFRKTAKQAAKDIGQTNAELSALESKLTKTVGKPSQAGESLISKTRKGLLDAVQRKEFENTDGLTMSINMVKKNVSYLDRYKSSGIKEADAAVKYLQNNLVPNILEPNVGEKNVDAFLKAVVDENYNEAHRISQYANSADLAKGLSQYSAKVKKTLLDLEKHSAGGADTVNNALENVILGLERLHHHADLTAGYLIKRGELRDELDAIVNKVNSIGGKKVSFSKKDHVEIYPGVYIDQSLAGNAGDMLRTFTSSAASTTALLADDRRITGQKFLSSGYSRRRIDRSNENWAKGHADYVNNALMRDVVARRMVEDLANGVNSGQALNNAKKWISENSTEARRWKSEVKQNMIERGKAMSNPSYNFNNMIDEMAYQIKSYLPEVSSENGKSYGNLYQKALDGLTVKDSLDIHYRDRHDVMHAVQQANDSFVNFYKNAVSAIFHIVGTLPEDHAVRHPFFNMTYEASAKRITRNLEKEARRSNPKITDAQIKSLIENRKDAITATATNRAYKELMTRLYSVERHTDPGKFLRFVTPFFMAQQNSSRFWLGISLRNPGVAYTLAKIYNIPYRSGLVTDPAGNLVSQSNPWDTQGDKQRMDWLFGTQISPTNLDVIFQGQMPILPTFGAPGSGTLTAEMMKWAAKKDGIEPFIKQHTGKTLDEFTSAYITPFYTKQGDTSIVGNLAQSVLPVNSWIISLAALSEGKFPLPQAKVRWDTRLSAARDEITMQALMDGAPLNPDDINKQAVLLAKKSLIAEVGSSFVGPIAAGKVAYGTTTDLTQQMNAAINAAGGDYNAGMVKFTQSLENQGYENASAITSVLNSSTVDNRYGLISNSATISGIQSNLKSFSHVDKYQTNNPFLGALFNIPNKDNTYSPIADDAMYGMNINGKPLKTRNLTPEEASKQQQLNAGWALYFSYIDQLSASAAAQGIDIKDPNYSDAVKRAKEIFHTVTAKQFPYWAAKNESIELGKSDRYIAIADYFLKDKTFMTTVGRKNKAIAGLREYMNNRAIAVSAFQENAQRTGYTTITAAANQKYALYMSIIGTTIKNKNKDFALMYDRYLSQDELNPINPALVGGE